MRLAPESWIAAIAYTATAALFAMLAVSALVHQRRVHRLPALDALPPAPEALPARVSVVVAARDEADAIQAGVRGLLAQRGIDLEVVVVSDRSVDGTADLVREVAAADRRVQVIEVTELPERWLGKCHACQVGATAATGDWLLFTDADCQLRPDVIARALAVTARDGVDHVTLTPGPIDATLGGYAWHCVFLASLVDWISRTNQDLPGAHVGVGAFNLVRTTTWRAFGGHEALRLTILDDVRLGLLVRRAGGRTRGFLGGDDSRCHWGTSLRQGIRLTEKNYYAAIGFRPLVAGLLVALVAALSAVIVTGLLSGTWLGLAAGLSGGLLALPALVFCRRLGWPPVAALLAPFCYPVVVFAVARSAIITARQGGIRWRGSFYPLPMLRDGMVR